MKRIALLTALAVLAGCSENYWMTQSLKDAVTATQTVVKEKIAKGQMTEAPVQTQFGWHVIRLDDERATKVPTFEEAKPELQQLMQRQVVQKAVADLRAKAKVE